MNGRTANVRVELMFDPNIKLIPTSERPGAQGEKIYSERLCEKKRTILCYQELCRTSVSDCNKICYHRRQRSYLYRSGVRLEAFHCIAVYL